LGTPLPAGRGWTQTCSGWVREWLALAGTQTHERPPSIRVRQLADAMYSFSWAIFLGCSSMSLFPRPKPGDSPWVRLTEPGVGRVRASEVFPATPSSALRLRRGAATPGCANRSGVFLALSRPSYRMVSAAGAWRGECTLQGLTVGSVGRFGKRFWFVYTPRRRCRAGFGRAISGPDPEARKCDSAGMDVASRTAAGFGRDGGGTGGPTSPGRTDKG